MQSVLNRKETAISSSKPPPWRKERDKDKITKAGIVAAIVLASQVHLLKAQLVCDAGFYVDGTDCTVCPAGYQCSNGMAQTLCVAGKYSFRGSSLCSSCPSGYQCTGVTISNPKGLPTKCAAGTYSNAQGTLCEDCLAGSYCPNGAVQSTCPTGHTSAARASICDPCPAGYACPNGLVTSKVQCSSGTYSLGSAQSCSTCLPGYYCPSTSYSNIRCPPGTYNDVASQTVCKQCPSGKYCPGSSMTAALPCPAGSYSVAGSLECTTCPAGFSCAVATSQPTMCAQGSFSLAGSSSCTPCVAGQECSLASSAGVACPAGKYSVAGSAFCLDCPAGKQCSTGTPQSCGSGSYSTLGSTSGCQTCPAGYKCSSIDQEPILCPLGYYSLAGATTCTLCEASNYCPTPQQKLACSTGTFCPSGTISPLSCPVGFSCSGTTTTPTPCADGLYRDLVTGTCISCPAGYTCEDRTTATPVQSGYYSPDGVSKSYICPAGYSCIGLNTLQACVKGQYSDDGDLNCNDCAIGMACPDTRSSQAKIDCTALEGFYNDVSKQEKCKICPAGAMCPRNQPLPISCDDGQYSAMGSATCTDCPPGYYCPIKTLAQPAKCLLGTYSIGKQSSCTICPAGYGCDSVSQFPCDSGQISLQGDGVCRYYSASELSPTIDSLNTVVTFLQCSPGTYKLAGMLVCSNCPKGHYCPSLTNPPIVCDMGQYQDQEGQTSCKLCNLGTYSFFGESICHVCPAGHFCPDPTSAPQQCQVGTYSVAGSVACTPCDDGYICEFKEQTSNPQYQLCPAGFYCFYDSANDFKFEQKPCPSGFYQPLRGQNSDSQCIQCPEGFYCPKGSETPIACTPGSYCPQGTSNNQQQQCVEGYFLDTFNAGADVTQFCKLCPEGTYCPRGTVVPLKCPIGYYCPAGSTTATFNSRKCPDGTYSGPFSLKSVDQCRPCPAGFVCMQTSSTINGIVKSTITDIIENANAMPIPCLPGFYKSNTGSGQCTKCRATKPCPYYGLTTDEIGIYCEPGYFCPQGTRFPNEFPCPSGTYSDSTMITEVSQCLPCPQKYACFIGTNTLTKPRVPCAPGFFCPQGTQYPTQFPCPIGTYSPFTDNYQVSQCIDCPPGQYCASAGLTQPTGYCAKGYYCPAKSTTEIQIACPEGTFLNYTGAMGKSECRVCPLGSYCIGASVNPIPCPPATYGDWAGIKSAVDCKKCPAGWSCPQSGMIKPLVCGTGLFSAESSTSCTICPFNNYCSNITTSQDEVKVCPRGYICAEGLGVKPYNPNHACPAGYYCQNSIKYECPKGTYNAVLAAEDLSWCISVPEGYFTDVAASTSFENNLCKRGYYCPQESSKGEAMLCPAGTYRNIPGAGKLADCAVCPTGHYCPDQTMDPFICPIGYYCTIGLKFAIPCPIGTFGASQGLREMSECTPCFAGRYCSQKGLHQPDGLCDPGYYCIQGAFTSTPTDGVTGKECPVGGYCGLGSQFVKICPSGTYNPNTQKSVITDCVPCTAGKYCAGVTATAPTGLTGNCKDGYYCTGGSKTPTQYASPPGSFSLAGNSTYTSCLPGTYNPLVAQKACLQCPAGYLCPNIGMSTLNDCPAGYYCPAGQTLPSPCLAGTYNDQTNMKASSDCKPCPGGKYCATAGLSAPTGLCDAGFYCTKNAVVRNPPLLINFYGPCPAGSYCLAGSAVRTLCPPGTFRSTTGGSTATGSTGCSNCDAGRFCNVPGQIAATGNGACAAGYYCPAGSKTDRPAATRCPAGSRCGSGASTATLCAPGTYQNQIGQDVCLTCPPGYYCLSNTTDFSLNVCPIGSYCPASTTTATGTLCPAGFYTAKTKSTAISDCIPCDPGKTCTNAPGQIATLADCPAGQFCKLGAPLLVSQIGAFYDSIVTNVNCQAGFYCPLGSSFQIPCPGGKYCGTTNLAQPTGNCAAGFYCIAQASLASPVDGITGNICPVGSYCPAGSAQPTLCPSGTFNPSTGKSLLSDCLQCTAGSFCKTAGLSAPTATCPKGFFCPGGNKQAYDNICPIGFYCPAGSPNKIACSGPNEYQDMQGQSACINPCPKGYQCTDSARTQCEPQKSELSFYCDGTQKTPKYCDVGTYNTIDGSDSKSDCKDCPPGYYCPNAAGQAKIIQCPSGSYCPEKQGTYLPCPIGYYCPLGTNVPLPCSPGFFCNSTSISDPQSLPCQQGYYCTYETYYVAANDLSSPAFYCNTADKTKIRICTRGAINATQTQCPKGSFCPAGSETPTECPIGTFSNQTGLTIISQCMQCSSGKFCQHRGQTTEGSNCSAGYYCPEGAQLSTNTPVDYICGLGNYCPEGVNAQIPCPIGKYQNKRKSDSCLLCPEGFYCQDLGTVTPLICPMGKYCPAGSNSGLDCPRGTFSSLTGLKLSSQCQKCLSGFYCPVDGQTSASNVCQAGYYCDNTLLPGNVGFITGTPDDIGQCPPGSYCEAGAVQPLPCPPGTYSTTAMLISVQQCTPCPAGKICPKFGISSTNQMLDCPAGYYCKTGGAISPNSIAGGQIKICDAGYYCPSGSIDQVQCPKGSYNPDLGQTVCRPCPEGFQCENTGMKTPDNCQAGSYCPQGSYVNGVFNLTRTPCLSGTYNDKTNLKMASECSQCPVGRFCLAGSTTTGTNCPAGLFCPLGSESGLSNIDIGSPYVNNIGRTIMCPKGHQCPQATSYPVPCDAGSYQDTPQQQICIACPATTYTQLVGQPQCISKCDNGFYCIKGSKISRPYDGITGQICEIGSMCNNGGIQQCSPGTYQSIKMQSFCDVCPTGYYCPNYGTSLPLPCPEKRYCPEGTSVPKTCPDGTYAADGKYLETMEQHCIPCKTGKYCQGGEYSDDNRCDAGYFCRAGAAVPNDKNMLCPAGFYCEEGTIKPTKCSNGTFSTIGAKSDKDCTSCDIGYYCPEGTTKKIACPEGSYCPLGAQSPILCPLGTFGPNQVQKQILDCKTCPAGSLCNVTGVIDPGNYLCPVGYYCERGTQQPVKCPPGKYRAVLGGQSIASCFDCDGGYYCPNFGTIVPIACRNGTYCPKGRSNETWCSPGFYCPAKTQVQIICPRGFFCPGKSEFMFKCENGTYCPQGSAFPIQCPAGSFGSGYADNGDLKSSCVTCGRGMYSNPLAGNGICFDCTPGYVCLGNTSTSTPLDKNTENGYLCPAGYYCPKGSYEERPCPVGTFNKHKGKGDLTDCIPCVDGYYNDLMGQAGCKKCGPTSYSTEGALTCNCNGVNRRFVKSIGSCLCENGYKPKDGMKDQDSSSDCETIVKLPCKQGQKIDLSGNCIDDDNQVCAKQCFGSGGSLVEGTGVCSCAKLVQVDQICNADCRKNQTQTTLNKNGSMTITDPASGLIKTIDPSTIPGFIGDFKCQTLNGSCQIYSVGKSDTGDFTYDYKPNQNILSASGLPISNSTAKKMRILRELQESSTSPSGDKITNPVMCLKLGSAVLFTVNSNSKQYPRYMKDSILNTNPNFDYGQFLELQNTIEKGSKLVNAFSFVFSQPGVYVFQDSLQQDKITIIGVVKENQDCSTKDANIQSATVQALASIGIVSQSKNVVPNWSFIIGTFAFIILMSFGFVTLVIVLHNRNEAQVANSKNHYIYYDRVSNMENEELNRSLIWRYLLCLCCRRNKGQGNEMNKIVPGGDIEISYDDLQKLLDEFKAQMEVLKAKLREDSQQKPQEDDQPQVPEDIDEEAELVRELHDLREFVNNNKECIEEFFNIKRGGAAGQHDSHPHEMEEHEKDDSNKVKNSEARELIQQQKAVEEETHNKITNQIRQQGDEIIAKISDQTDAEKDKLLEAYKKKLNANPLLTDSERSNLLDEMNDRLSKLNGLLDSEQSSSDKRLADALARRRKKKEELQQKFQEVHQQAEHKTNELGDRLVKIAQMESQENGEIENEIRKMRVQELANIDNELLKNKNEKISEMEDRLKKLRDSGGKISGKEQLELGDLLNDYGKLVKDVDAELIKEREKQAAELETKLAGHRKKRQLEAEKRRREREEQENERINQQQKSMQSKIDNIKTLIKPVQNQDTRLDALLNSADGSGEALLGREIIRPESEFKDSSEKGGLGGTDQAILALKKKLELINDEEDAKINAMIDQFKKASEKQNKEYEQRKAAIQAQLKNGNISEEERQRLLNQFNDLKNLIEEQQRREAEDQDSRLEEALRRRRQRKQAIIKEIGERQQELVQSIAEKTSEELIKANFDKDPQTNTTRIDKEQIKTAFNKLNEKFEGDEMVQVIENYLDTKNMSELQKLMLALFEERAKDLRRYVFELMTQKQTELELIREEFRPRYDLLKDKRAKGLITSDETYRQLVEKVNKEEGDRRIDVEISIGEMEQKMEEDLQLIAIQAKQKAEEALKERQTKERQMMIDMLMEQTNPDNEIVHQYLKREQNQLEKQLAKFKEEKAREKEALLRDIEAQRLKREQELIEKEQSLLNWEGRMRDEESKQMEIFSRQKDAIIKKKMAEQSTQILLAASKGQIDNMKLDHEKALKALDTAIEQEQKRQMAMMREKMKNRVMESEHERVRREVKMALIIKAKQERQQKNMNSSHMSSASGTGAFESVKKTKENEWKACIDKVAVMKFGPIEKKRYCADKCVSIVNRFEYSRMMELNRKYRGMQDEIFEAVATAQKVDQSLFKLDNVGSTLDARQDSLDDSTSLISVANLTFKDLIDHVNVIENNYNQLSQIINQ